MVLTDLGSAVLTAESVLDLLDEDVAARVRLADAPFVEGAVAAAVTAHGGADLAAVARVGGARRRRRSAGRAGAGRAARSPTRRTACCAPPRCCATRSACTPGPRPSSRGCSRAYDATVRVNGANAASVLELMKLGAKQGVELHDRGRGPQAAQARDALVAAVEGGFGEV